MKRLIVQTLLALTFPLWVFPTLAWQAASEVVSGWEHARDRKRRERAERARVLGSVGVRPEDFE